jgi:hypothetical protein
MRRPAKERSLNSSWNLLTRRVEQAGWVANKSAEIGYSMRDANPQITRMKEEEVYKRLAYSARLLKTVYKATMK